MTEPARKLRATVNGETIHIDQLPIIVKSRTPLQIYYDLLINQGFTPAAQYLIRNPEIERQISEQINARLADYIEKQRKLQESRTYFISTLRAITEKRT